MRSLGIVCVLLVWLSCVVCKEWWDNDVKSINADNILELIGKKKHVIVKFYTPWCYFCKKMNTDYEQLNDKYKDSEQVLIAKVNCDDDRAICNFYEVHGYPQLLHFKPNSVKSEGAFKWNRTFELMNKWIEGILGEAGEREAGEKEVNEKDEGERRKEKEREEKQKSAENYRFQKVSNIFENIFECFEKTESQQAHLNAKLVHLEEEVNKVSNSDQQLFKRITIKSGSINYVQAGFIYILGSLVGAIIFYFSIRLSNKVGGYSQVLP